MSWQQISEPYIIRMNCDKDLITEEQCLAAIALDCSKFKYVVNQTPKICLAAVKQNGLLLGLVKQQSAKICRAAINQNSDALQFVKNPTSELCLLAEKRRKYEKLFMNLP